MQFKKTIVIKPTMNCNLRCGYCYEFARNGTTYCKDTMNIEQLNSIVVRTAKLFPNSKILWMFHGGEPLLMGAGYIEEFTNCIRSVNEKYSVDYKIALQTNGTMLTDECIRVLEKNIDLLSERIVSISIDGPKEINDATRRLSTGESPYNKIEDAIRRVKKSKLSFSTISVVGSHNVKEAARIFGYLKEIGANLSNLFPITIRIKTVIRKCTGLHL